MWVGGKSDIVSLTQSACVNFFIKEEENETRIVVMYNTIWELEQFLGLALFMKSFQHTITICKGLWVSFLFWSMTSEQAA